MIDNCGAFSGFELHPDLIRGLEDSKHFRATGVQEEALEKFGMGRPLILHAPSGTGKTCAFSLMLFQHLVNVHLRETWRQPPVPKGSILGLVLVPSPELCEQVACEARAIGRYVPLDVTVIVSSIKLADDWEVISSSHIVIGTPGIILKLLMKKKLRLYDLSVLVIDEWDKMLSDSGLRCDLERILARPAPILQRMICASATFTQTAFTSLSKILPGSWQVARYEGHNKHLHHYLARVGSFDERLNVMVEFMRNVSFHQALVFCNIRQLSTRAAEVLNQTGFPAEFLSSHNEQRERLDRVAEFRDVQLRCIVTTDITARGLDVDNVNMVICLDFPHDDETFLHRVGRAGRFNTNGASLTFYKRRDEQRIQAIRGTCHIKFRALESDGYPIITLPLLRNETHIENFRRLREIEIDTKKKADDEQGVPLMPFCDMNNSYWSHYSAVCREFRPPFM